MFLFRNQLLAGSSIAASLTVLLLLLPLNSAAREFEASTAPDKKFVLKLFPKFYFASTYFGDDGKARHIPNVPGLLYAELPVQIQYGVTGSFSVGAVLPLGMTYQEELTRADPVGRFALREAWLTLQHRWLTFPFISSSSIRIKLPLQDKKNWEDGLKVGDGQIDIFPVFHSDYFNQEKHFYCQFSAGYKFRLKTGGYKPFDEIRLYSRAGIELFSELQVRFFLSSDLTWFKNGEYPRPNPPFFEQDGYLTTIGYGVSLWPRPTLRLEVATAGDLVGRHHYRGIRWIIGTTKIF
jgi:hypothetical protein